VGLNLPRSGLVQLCVQADRGERLLCFLQFFRPRPLNAALERQKDTLAMRISEITRRDIFDAIRIEEICWWGRLEETEFLSRLYDLSQMPSTDSRYTDASGDIWKHRVANDDWED
jgi:hypothetical protein